MLNGQHKEDSVSPKRVNLIFDNFNTGEGENGGKMDFQLIIIKFVFESRILLVPDVETKRNAFYHTIFFCCH